MNLRLGGQVNNPEIVRENFNKIQQAFNSPAGGFVWGTGVGDITDQTDLISFVASAAGPGNTAYSWGNHASAGYLTGITGSQVTGALGFTPYNALNPAGYISGITGTTVIGALGYTPYNASNPAGYISGVTGAMVTGALGYTPYNASNPAGYITASSTDVLSNKTWQGNIIPATYGGTGLSSFTAGDLLYASNASTLVKRSVGTTGQVLTVVGGLPAWAAPSGSGWGLTGNSGTVAGTNYLGTSDAVALSLRTNAVERLGISATGVVTVVGGLGQLDNGYQGWSLYRTVPNNLTYLQIYAVGDANPVVLQTEGVRWLTYKRGTFATVFAGLGTQNSLQDNDGFEPSTSKVVAGNSFHVYSAAGTPSISFWSPFAVQTCRGRISTVDNNAFASRAGEMIFEVNYGNGGNGYSNFKEVMRFKPTGNVLVGTTTDVATSLLTLNSSNKGFLLPRMLTTNVNAITAPANGLMLYDTDLNTLKMHNGTAWQFQLHAASNVKTTAAAPYVNDGYVQINIGGTLFKLMTTA